MDESTGEILIEANDEITPEKLEILRKAGLETLEVFVIPMQDEADVVRNTLRKDPTHSQEEALNRIYNLLRPGEPPRADSAREILNKLFFNPKRYDLARVGRYKLNQKLPHEYLLPGRDVRKRLGLGLPDLNHSTLCREDFIVIVKYLLLLRAGGELVTDRGPSRRSPTTSTTSATAASARWASCSPTSSTSAWRAWPASSASACRCRTRSRSPRPTWSTRAPSRR